MFIATLQDWVLGPNVTFYIENNSKADFIYIFIFKLQKLFHTVGVGVCHVQNYHILGTLYCGKVL